MKARLFVLILCIYFEARCRDNKYLITKFSKVNIRTGPDFRYSVKYTYIKKNTVLRIKNIFDEWYLVEDLEGDTGWIYKNLVASPKKTQFVTVKTHNVMTCYIKQSLESRVVFKASYLVNFKVKFCSQDWCLLEKDGISGWCENKNLWGL
jgi:SH3-like domain-containing protein